MFLPCIIVVVASAIKPVHSEGFTDLAVSSVAADLVEQFWGPTMSCQATLYRYRQSRPSGSPLPQALSDDQLVEFTLSGAISSAEFFVDDSNQGQGTHYRLPRRGMWIL